MLAKNPKEIPINLLCINACKYKEKIDMRCKVTKVIISMVISQW